MKEFLPSITVQKGFYTSNTSNMNPQKRFYSYGNANKKNYQIYQNNNIIYKNSTLINPNNFVIVSNTNTNKDEVNSNKDNTSMTYYNRDNRGFSNNNNIHIKNIMLETFCSKNIKSNIAYKKNKLENILLNSNNNIKVIKNNNNEINIVNKNTLKNVQFFLPEIQNDIKIKKSSPLINNVNNNSINLSVTNSIFKAKKELNNNNNSKKNPICHETIDCQNIHPIKAKDSLTALGFFDNKKNIYKVLNDQPSNSNRKTLSTDIKYEQDKNKNEENNNNNKKNLKVLFNNIKKINNKKNTENTDDTDNNNQKNNNNEKILKNKINNNDANIKICPICHKEKEINKYAYHLSLHPSKILDWLYLGSYRNACDNKDIKNLGINYVLNCAIECKESFPSDIKYCHLKISDRPKFKVIKFLDKASDFINEAQSNNGIILVHCQLGISRSTTCVISYFIKYLGYTAMSALNFIKKKRTQVMPNYGFLDQLKVYEKNNLGCHKNEFI